MGIRSAKIEDSKSIANLLAQLGYRLEDDIIKEKVKKLIDSPNDEIIVYEQKEEIIAFISIHFSTQLGFVGDFATIGYFVVDANVRGLGIGKQLEEYCSQLAKERNCALIEVYSSEKRTEAHKFYIRQGYKPHEKYFLKEIDEKL